MGYWVISQQLITQLRIKFDLTWKLEWHDVDVATKQQLEERKPFDNDNQLCIGK